MLKEKYNALENQTIKTVVYTREFTFILPGLHYRNIIANGLLLCNRSS